jgi:malonyl CoA-acyl carrier protein transacylase
MRLKAAQDESNSAPASSASAKEQFVAAGHYESVYRLCLKLRSFDMPRRRTTLGTKKSCQSLASSLTRKATAQPIPMDDSPTLSPETRKEKESS